MTDEIPMIKKVLAKTISSMLALLLVAALSTHPALANKAGVNLGGIWNDKNMEKAGQMVGTGGWITVLSCELEKLEPALARALNANIILRLYNGGSVFKPEDAIAFVNMLGELDTGGRKIYVMPWNEPNLFNVECDGQQHCAEYVNRWISALIDTLKRADLWEKKVLLLSPTLDQEGGDNYGAGLQSYQSFINDMRGIKPGFWRQFHGIAVTVYVYNDSVPTNEDLYRVPSYAGVSDMPIFVVEGAYLIPGVKIVYENDRMADYIRRAHSTWTNAVAITPFAYDPHSDNPYFFGRSGNNCGAACQETKKQITSGSTERGGNGPGFSGWQLVNCPDISTCQVSAQYCGGIKRVCKAPVIAAKDPCCPFNETKGASGGELNGWLDRACSIAGSIPGFSNICGTIRNALDNISHTFYGTVTVKNIETPGKKSAALFFGDFDLSGNPESEPEKYEGAAGVGYNFIDGIPFGVGPANLLSSPLDPINDPKEQKRLWQELAETQVNTEVNGEGVAGDIKANVFDIEPLNTAADRLGSFARYPDSAYDPNAPAAENVGADDLAQTTPTSDSVLGARVLGDTSRNPDVCGTPQGIETEEETCPGSVGVGQTANQQTIGFARALGLILQNSLTIKNTYNVPHLKSIGLNLLGIKDPDNKKDSQLNSGILRAFVLPGEETTGKVSPMKDIPAKGTADLKIELNPSTISLPAPLPSIIQAALAFFGDTRCQTNPSDDLCQGRARIFSPVEKKVELKLRSLEGPLAAIEGNIAPKLDLPETSEVAYEPEAQNYSSNPVSLASAIGGHALGEQTVSEEETLTFPEKVGQFLGRIIAKIIIPN